MASEADYSAQTKRRRLHSPEDDAPKSKKQPDRPPPSPPPVSPPSAEACRAEVGAIYKAYDTLYKGGDGPQEAAAFQLLIEQASKGSLAAKRLATRLIPRFISKFPACSEAAAVLLLHCMDARVTDTCSAAIVSTIRHESLVGMGNVLEATTHLQDRAVPIVHKVATFLLRKLTSLQPHKAPPGPENGDASPAAAPTTPAAYSAATADLLERAFKSFPRVILAACLTSLRSNDPATYQGSCNFLQLRLTTPARLPHPPPAGLKPGQSLASRVLSTLPDTQQWLRQSVAMFLKETTTTSTTHSEAPKLLDKLLQQLPPPSADPSKPPTPLHRAGSQLELHPPNAHHHTPTPANGLHSPSPLHPMNGAGHAHTPSTAAGPSRFRDTPPAGVSLHPAPALHRPHDLYPTPGGSLCRADACLWISGIPSGINEAVVSAECSRYGNVEEVHAPPGLGDAAYVVFQSVRDAAVCFESMAETSPWGGRPLAVQFCSSLPAASTFRLRQPHQPSQFIWVGGGAAGGLLQDLPKVLAEAGLPSPRQAVQVSGRSPGLLVEMADHSTANRAVEALRQRLHRQDASTPGLMGATAVPVPGALRSLWIGQIGDKVTEAEVLSAFQRFGEVVSFRFARSSNCAFLDYATAAAAARAREAMNRCRMGNTVLRVDWKDDKNHPLRKGKHHHLLSTLNSIPLSEAANAMRAAPGLPGPPPLPTSAPQPTPYRTPSLREALAPAGGTAAASSASAAAPSTAGRRERDPSRPDPWGPPPAPGTSASPHPPTPVPSTSADWGNMPQPPISPPPPPPDDPPPLPPPPTATPPPLPHTPPPPLPTPTNPTLPLSRTPSLRPPSAPPPNLPPPPHTNAHPWPPHHPAPPHWPPHHLARPPARAWEGRLAKSGTIICTLQCRDPPPPSQTPGPGILEPLNWPDTLDVQMRVDVHWVLNHVYATAPEGSRAVRRLVLGSGTDDKARAGLTSFLKYLVERSRAGVVKLLNSRMLYLVPPSDSVCRQLAVNWEPQVCCVFAVVVPQPASK